MLNIISLVITVLIAFVLYKYYFHYNNNNNDNTNNDTSNIENFEGEVETTTTTEDTKTSEEVVEEEILPCPDSDTYLEFNGETYCGLSHIVEIPINSYDSEYDEDQQREITRNIYKLQDATGYTYRTGCKKNSRWNSNTIGTTTGNCDSTNRILLAIEKSNCVLAKRGYCIPNTSENILTSKSDQSQQKDAIIIPKSGPVYINRTWINMIDYDEYVELNIPQSKIELEYIYCDRKEYTNELSKTYSININPDIKFSSVSYNVSNDTKDIEQHITNLLTINKDYYFNVHKRNVLACLWYDGEITFENNYTGSDGIKFNDTRDIIEFSPYITIRFKYKFQAKQFVANILNKIQSEDAKVVSVLASDELTTSDDGLSESTTTTTQAPTTTQPPTTTTTNPDAIKTGDDISPISELPSIEESFAVNLHMNNDNITNESLSLIADGHFL